MSTLFKSLLHYCLVRQKHGSLKNFKPCLYTIAQGAVFTLKLVQGIRYKFLLLEQIPCFHLDTCIFYYLGYVLVNLSWVGSADFRAVLIIFQKVINARFLVVLSCVVGYLRCHVPLFFESGL